MVYVKLVFGMKQKQKYCFKNFHFKTHSLENDILNSLKTDLLYELPFHDELSIKISKAFKRYAGVIKLIYRFKISFSSIRS